MRANASVKSHAELDASPEIDIGDLAAFADNHAELLPSLPNLQHAEKEVRVDFDPVSMAYAPQSGEAESVTHRFLE